MEAATKNIGGKRNMNKKIIGTILVISLCFISVYAVTILGDIDYWYSDDTKIGSWSYEPTFATSETPSCPSNLTTNVSTGFGAWSYAGIGNGYLDDFDSADIPVYGGPYTEIKEINPSYPTTATGSTSISATYIGAYQYGTILKDGYRIDSATMYIATDRATSKTYKHEAGHALGWFGHSTSSADIMYAYNTSVTSLTSRDINHLVQIY